MPNSPIDRTPEEREEAIRRALGPLHQVMDESRINWDYDPSRNSSTDFSSIKDIIKILTGRQTATVRNDRPKSAAHELKHLYSLPDLGAVKGEHPFIHAQHAFDARNQDEFEEAQNYARALNLEDVARLYADKIPAAEYEMGARLQFDPDRGHGVEEVVASSLEDLLGTLEGYEKWRNKQSHISRRSR